MITTFFQPCFSPAARGFALCGAPYARAAAGGWALQAIDVHDVSSLSHSVRCRTIPHSQLKCVCMCLVGLPGDCWARCKIKKGVDRKTTACPDQNRTICILSDYATGMEGMMECTNCEKKNSFDRTEPVDCF